MAIKELLKKAKMKQELELKSEEIIEPKKIENSFIYEGVLFDSKILPTLKPDELNSKYDEVYSWTETHFCLTGSDNKLDINDRPYNHDLWVEHDELLKLIAIEMLNRPSCEKLRESRG